jgi:dTDP-4-dehydrorhamnose reductase
MNILITGANGQLGYEMRSLARENAMYSYYFTDVEELDICDEQAVKTFVDRNSIDLIVNCAAYTAVDTAEDQQELNDRLNHIAPGYLARAAQKNGAAIIHISTDYVFDGTNHVPYTEDDPTCPATAYGAAKLAGEKLVMKLCKKAVVIRTSWLYSPYGNNFVKTMIRLGNELDTFGVIFDQIGTPTYARDLAAALYTIIGKGVVRGVYHFSNEGACSWYDFTIAIYRLAENYFCKVTPIHTADYPSKTPRPHYSVLDKTKIKKTFGIQISHWEKSLANAITRMPATLVVNGR